MNLTCIFLPSKSAKFLKYIKQKFFALTCLIEFKFLFRQIPDFLPSEVIPHTSTGDGSTDGTSTSLTSDAELLTEAVGVVPVGTPTPLPTTHLWALLSGLELDDLDLWPLLQVLTLDQGHGATLVAVSGRHSVVIQTASVVAMAVHSSSANRIKKLFHEFHTFIIHNLPLMFAHITNGRKCEQAQ